MPSRRVKVPGPGRPLHGTRPPRPRTATGSGDLDQPGGAAILRNRLLPGPVMYASRRISTPSPASSYTGGITMPAAATGAWVNGVSDVRSSCASDHRVIPVRAYAMADLDSSSERGSALGGAESAWSAQVEILLPMAGAVRFTRESFMSAAPIWWMIGLGSSKTSTFRARAGFHG